VERRGRALRVVGCCWRHVDEGREMGALCYRFLSNRPHDT
jgi:hypothetical protein